MTPENIVVTVYHDGVKAFFNTFLDSIIQQTSKNYLLYVFNDSATKNIIPINYSDKLKYKVIALPKLSIIENRIWIFEFLKNVDVENVHCVDCDDTLQGNYIEKSEKLLCKYDLLCHDFNLVNENLSILEKNYWSCRFSDNETKISQDFIYTKNVIGLGNTSFKKGILTTKSIHYSKFASIPDWFIFFQIVYGSNFRIGFTSNALFNYRQHNNLAKLLENDYDTIIIKIKNVKNHYRALQSIGINEFNNYIERLDRLLSFFTKDLYYCYINQRSIINYFWWEEIFKILEFYENRN